MKNVCLIICIPVSLSVDRGGDLIDKKCLIVTTGSEIICIPVSLSLDRGGDLIGKNNVEKGATAADISTPNSQAPKSPNTRGQNGPQSHKTSRATL